MKQPTQNESSYYAALVAMRDQERQQETKPRPRKSTCPPPATLLDLALNQLDPTQILPESAVGIAQHVGNCVACKLLLEASRAALANEPLPELPQTGPGRVAAWIMSGESVRRHTPRLA